MSSEFPYTAYFHIYDGGKYAGCIECTETDYSIDFYKRLESDDQLINKKFEIYMREYNEETQEFEMCDKLKKGASIEEEIVDAQRQINGSNGGLIVSMSPAASSASAAAAGDRACRLLTPCGPSIADALHKYTSGGRDGRVSVSSQFDPFLDASHDQLVGGGGLGSPQRQQHHLGAPSFSPNQQLDHLEQRFRNANFRPPWALKSQTTFD
ncbi:hypothetical protein GGI21_002164 [Coemansia aciculifera]|nr:hypothetical protein GGI21_002164 [Coemansia aciculifera]